MAAMLLEAAKAKAVGGASQHPTLEEFIQMLAA